MLSDHKICLRRRDRKNTDYIKDTKKRDNNNFSDRSMEVKLPALLGNYNRHNNRPTNQPTDQPTD